MSTARTYTCGDAGGVRKLVNLTGSWVDVSLPTSGIPSALSSTLFDVATDPNNGDKVFVVGDFGCASSGVQFFGIAVSSNGGTTWQIPTGNYQSVLNVAICYYKWTKLTVVDSNTIYVSGIINPNSGLPVVIKSVDGGLTFNFCTALPATVANQDATSVHFSTPLIGVVGLNNFVLKTVDGGVTWITLNGGTAVSTSTPSPNTPLPVGQITGIHITQDESYILAIGDGSNFILETTPVISPAPLNSAGVAVDSWQKNFYPSGGFPGMYGYHLSQLNPALGNDNFIFITGYGELGLYSDTPRTTWISVPPPGYALTPPGSFTRLAAHFFTQDFFGKVHGFYIKGPSDVYFNVDGFNPSPGLETFSETAPYRVNSVWTWYQETPPETCYLLTECTTRATLITNTNLSGQLGSVVTLSGISGCYTVSAASACTGAISVTVTNTYQTCLACNVPPQPCYRLHDCSGVQPDIITNSDFSLYVNKVITISTSPGVCWSVSLAADCTGSTPLNTQVTNSYPDCQTCLQTCYVLTDCNKQFSPIITSTNISAYVNQTVTLSNYPGVCWNVSVSTTCVGSVVLSGTITNAYANCVSCLQKCYVLVDCTGANPDIITSSDITSLVGKIVKISECPDVCWTVLNSSTCTKSQPVTITTFYIDCPTCLNIPKADVILKPRSVFPNYGDDQAGCSVQYMEKVNCNFSENWYSKMLSRRYGLKSCEEDTHDKWWVKKMLLMLDLIKDSSACHLPSCNAPCALNSEIVIYFPTECPAVLNLTSSLIVPISCDPVNNLTSSISF